MFLVNFGHPITDSQLRKIKKLCGQTVKIISVPVHIDNQRELAEQAQEIVDAVGLTRQEWQREPIIINLPGLSVAGAALLAEIHGRAGYFVPVLRLVRIAAGVPPRFGVREIVYLQSVRDNGRKRR